MLLAIVAMAWAPSAVSIAGNCPEGGRGTRDTTPVTFTVAHDGSGDFRTIQEAIDAVRPDHTGQAFIFVKSGLYPEKLHIRCSRLTILGQHRDSTRIVYAELRSAWRQRNGDSDGGSAVVNLDSSVTDIVLANLTVYNNYGSLHGSHDHQFAIRGGGTRVILLDCNVLADGGDTVSLWNLENGMYYHSGCSFEGWVDFVCPRGWCFVTDSRFFGHNLNASIWHDGSADSSQKFVLRNCRFDGVQGFALGRRHRDAQFYLVDCRFSPNMADRPIYRAATSTAPDRWGDRAYFAGCTKEGTEYRWLADNLPPGAPAPPAITAAWTFGGRWDPEAVLSSLLPAEYLRGRSVSSGTVSP
jgi:pectinesterase